MLCSYIVQVYAQNMKVFLRTLLLLVLKKVLEEVTPYLNMIEFFVCKKNKGFDHNLIL